MSVFDLFRGFFGVPGGYYRGDERRSHQDPLDDLFRFGFSFGPGGMRFQEPRGFGQIFKEMEEIFAGQDGFGHWSVPSIEAPPPLDGPVKGGHGGGSGNSLRDFMLKSPQSSPRSPSRTPPSATPKEGNSTSPQGPNDPFPKLRPFSKFHDLWKAGLVGPKEGERKEDGDLDSRVSSGGLDQILTPAPSQPKIRSFYKSVSVSKVVRPDGTVEERRTVRDSEGNEETTVSITGGPGVENQTGPLTPGDSRSSTDMQDDFSMFSKFFRGF
ncbi:HCLS1-associated protein X-1 isoform X2 [Triplophysa dalaica]|uniref:HCLS1-associated protein X-1 isoform X2 n=1 Tax=Triplophysa dalaica TaxID=1582913 RepID=UPI0024E02E95|nr:HCLS1-associated protein X-1 isoform X2 [Triplophysa dalaica]